MLSSIPQAHVFTFRGTEAVRTSTKTTEATAVKGRNWFCYFICSTLSCHDCILFDSLGDHETAYIPFFLVLDLVKNGQSFWTCINQLLIFKSTRLTTCDSVTLSWLCEIFVWRDLNEEMKINRKYCQFTASHVTKLWYIIINLWRLKDILICLRKV